MVISNTPLKQRGSAIVLALGITSIVVVLSVAMLTALSADMKRTQKVFALDAQHSLLYAAESKAKTLLIQHREDSEVTTTGQPWSQPWTFEQDGVKLKAQLYDTQGRFNINSLLLKNAPEDFFSPASVFERLGRQLEPMDALPAVLLARRTKQPWVGVSELKPVLKTEFLRIAPYITVYDKRKFGINVNTADPILLAALLEINVNDAQQLQLKGPYGDVEAFGAEIGAMELHFEDPELVREWVAVQSEHFILHTQIQGQYPLDYYTVFELKDDEWHIVQRSQGGLS